MKNGKAHLEGERETESDRERKERIAKCSLTEPTCIDYFFISHSLFLYIWLSCF